MTSRCQAQEVCAFLPDYTKAVTWGTYLSPSFQVVVFDVPMESSIQDNQRVVNSQ